MDDLTPLHPDEALYAFMDGELDAVNEQQLFDELAGNTELRGEMRDILSIRNAIHRDTLFPAPSVEAGVLTGAGLASAAAAGTTAAGTAATTSWLAAALPWLRVAGGVALGGIAMFLLMSRTSDTMSTDLPPATPGTAQVAPAPDPSPSQALAGPVRVDTVVVRRTVAIVPPGLREREAAVAAAENRLATDRLALAAERLALEEERRRAAATTPESPLAAAPTLRDVPPLSTVATTLGTSAPQDLTTLRSAAYIGRPTTGLPAQLRARSLPSGLQSFETIPASVRDALVPNVAFSLTFPLTSDHTFGVELATESFVQRFTGTIAGRPVQYEQVPTLFWMGAQYRYSPAAFSIVEGLRPYAELTAGMAFSQGPVGHASIGLQYSAGGPLTFSLGFDGAMLAYQSANTWFSSSKWGLTYGMTVDIGAWR